MKLKIGINGGGIGGLTAALALARSGHDVEVYEQTSSWKRVGADVNLTPNTSRALMGFDLLPALEESAARPTRRISRTWDTGAETSNLSMGTEAERRYGAPQLTIHRADLLDALRSRIDPASIKLGKRVVGVNPRADGADVRFAGGDQVSVDLLIGADGIHSPTRAALFGPDHPQFTGLVSYRSVVDTAKLDIPNLDAFTKWWGPTSDLQIVTFPLKRGKETFIFATTPQPDWHEESWTMRGDVNELRAAYADFHPEARALLDACTEVMKSALYVRDPLLRWSAERVTLLGDACHPMTPFMAQGAGMAIEDGVVLGRALSGVDAPGIPAALAQYEAARRSRTARVQVGSRSNEWLKDGGNADWVYGYDAWTAPLDDVRNAAA